ncbi:MAG: hypothetical protein NWF06_04240 [Candidatus Bathyarchaeota archaeon]|nr:hypothetical protein [Candidatus Bathyarchaeum sp.]
MGERQINEAIQDFVAIPLIILIGLYITASAIDPILHINNQTFKIIFTVTSGIPTLTLFFKKKYLQNKPTKIKE